MKTLMRKANGLSGIPFAGMFLLMMLLPVGLCKGQDYVYVSDSACVGAITRFYAGKPMHYMKSNDRNGRFLYSWSPVGSKFKSITLSGYDVRDFTVIGDTIYFCGDRPDGIGVYGWTKILSDPNLCQIHLYELQDNVFVTDVRRIRVFRNNNNLHVLLVGNYVDQNHQINAPSIVHVKNNAMFTVAYRGGEHFDDVEVLDNYVVTVARKGYDNPTNSPHFMRVLKRDGFSLHDGLFENSYAWGRQSAKDRILLQHVGGNRLVSVYHVDTALYINTYVVNPNGDLNLRAYHWMPATIKDPIRDVAYNDSANTFNVIHSSSSWGIASQIDCVMFPFLSLRESSIPIMNGFCSSCKALLTSTTKYLPDSYMVSGVSEGKMVLWHADSTECDSQLDFNVQWNLDIMSSITNNPAFDVISPLYMVLSCDRPYTYFRMVCGEGKETADDGREE